MNDNNEFSVKETIKLFLELSSKLSVIENSTAIFKNDISIDKGISDLNDIRVRLNRGFESFKSVGGRSDSDLLFVSDLRDMISHRIVFRMLQISKQCNKY